MKMFSDCSGECCICACGDACIAGHGDDYYSLASKEQIIARLDKGQYKSYTNVMINTLENVYGYKYNKTNKYTLHIRFDMNKDPNGELLWDTVIDALLSYAKKTDDELLVYKIVLEEEM